MGDYLRVGHSEPEAEPLCVGHQGRWPVGTAESNLKSFGKPLLKSCAIQKRGLQITVSGLEFYSHITSDPTGLTYKAYSLTTTIPYGNFLNYVRRLETTWNPNSERE
jgi:hypothetical protein